MGRGDAGRVFGGGGRGERKMREGDEVRVWIRFRIRIYSALILNASIAFFLSFFPK